MPVTLRLSKRISKARLLQKELRSRVWEAVAETASAIEKDVKGGPHAAPYRTGNLRRSYHVEFLEADLTALVGADPGIAPYAPHVEFGTKRSAPRPHLRPAAWAQEKPFEKRLAEAMDEAAEELP